MTLENAIDYTIKTLEWGLTQSHDTMTDRIKAVIDKLKNKKVLSSVERRVAGLYMFTYSMHHDPTVFAEVEDAAFELGVILELKAYALDFTQYSRRRWITTEADGISGIIKYILHGK